MNATVELSCTGCQGIFRFPTVWFFHRLARGKPPPRCSGCDPAQYRTV